MLVTSSSIVPRGGEPVIEGVLTLWHLELAPDGEGAAGRIPVGRLRPVKRMRGFISRCLFTHGGMVLAIARREPHGARELFVIDPDAVPASPTSSGAAATAPLLGSTGGAGADAARETPAIVLAHEVSHTDTADAAAVREGLPSVVEVSCASMVLGDVTCVQPHPMRSLNLIAFFTRAAELPPAERDSRARRVPPPRVVTVVRVDEGAETGGGSRGDKTLGVTVDTVASFEVAGSGSVRSSLWLREALPDRPSLVSSSGRVLGADGALVVPSDDGQYRVYAWDNAAAPSTAPAGASMAVGGGVARIVHEVRALSGCANFVGALSPSALCVVREAQLCTLPFDASAAAAAADATCGVVGLVVDDPSVVTAAPSTSVTPDGDERPTCFDLHKISCCGVDVSPCGRFGASGDLTGQLHVWRAASDGASAARAGAEPVATCSLPNAVRSMNWQPAVPARAGKLYVAADAGGAGGGVGGSGGADGIGRDYDAEVPEAHLRLLIGCMDGRVWSWTPFAESADPARRRAATAFVMEREPVEVLQCAGTVTCVLWQHPTHCAALGAASDAGMLWAATTTAGYVYVYDDERGRLVARWRVPPVEETRRVMWPVWSLGWSPCNRFIATGAEDTTTAVWDVAAAVAACTVAGQAEMRAGRVALPRVVTLQSHTAAVTCVDWRVTASGEVLATSSDDRSAVVHSCRMVPAPVPTESGTADASDSGPRSSSVAPLFEVRNVFRSRHGHLMLTYLALEPGPMGNHVAASTMGGNLYVWSLDDRGDVESVAPAAIAGVIASSGAAAVAIASNAGASPATGAAPMRAPEARALPTGDSCPDGATRTGSEAEEQFLRCHAPVPPVVARKTHYGSIEGLRWTRQGRLVTCSSDCTVNVMRVLPDDARGAMAVASAAGATVASSSEDVASPAARVAATGTAQGKEVAEGGAVTTTSAL